ncbi:MAG: acyl-CoA thioesterase [Alphaproteobacteria bacterium]|nr:acyl-CoA thioesterase [Alphaproteobacteria bacterium]
MTQGRDERRENYRHRLAIPTRWMDNDVYRHVNNVVYYSYFDTVVNEYLMKAGVLDYDEGEVIGFVVETTCQYHRPLRFPDVVDAMLRVAHLGNSSVRYEIALFRQGDDEPAATGHFVHVYVRRPELRPTPLPAGLRTALERITAR